MGEIKSLLDFTARVVEFTEMYSKCTKRTLGSCLSHEVIYTNSVVLVRVPQCLYSVFILDEADQAHNVSSMPMMHDA
jgi:hypothetical protein